MLNRIRLDDLLRRDLTVQWFEGVALVQGVCRQTLVDGSADRGFPSSEEVLLCAHGGIELLGTASSGQSVGAAGHTLSQMLGEDAPVRLRLVATQATAGDAGYPTLREFSEAVAYFERPDREGILRNLYLRASAARPRGDLSDGSVPAAEPEQKSEHLKPANKSLRTWLVLAGIAGGVLCAVIWGLAFSPAGSAASAVATVQNAVRSTLARVPSVEPVEKEEAKAENKPANSAPAKRAGQWLPSEKPGRTVDDGRPTRSASALRASSVPALLPVRPAPMAMLSGPDAVYDIRPDGSQAGSLYSARDADVLPPKSVYPKLPAAPPSGFSLPGQTVLEMVIGTNGLVERVKLRSAPRDIHEFMLVSAAKAWQFEPARLGGTPVRYLHTVVLTLQ
jgi:hypothetical protein